MHAKYSGWLRLASSSARLSLCGLLIHAFAIRADVVPEVSSLLLVTNLGQLRNEFSLASTTNCFIRLEGNVLWVNASEGRMVLEDSSGAAELKMDLQNQRVNTGDRIRLTANSTIVRQGAAFQIGVIGPVVDNNGVHGAIEKSGVVYLPTGRHPLRLDWFNGVESYALEVEYEGPELPRQKIPDTALFRFENSGSNWVNGLNYRCVQARGEVLPDFNSLPLLKSGTSAGFDVGDLPQKEHVGLEFTGFLEIRREGLYKFHLRSDDGSCLYLVTPSVRLEVVSHTPSKPSARPLAIGQTLPADEPNQWATVEGRVTFAQKHMSGLRLELSAGAGRLRVEVADGSGLTTTDLLNAKIRATGFCQSAFTTDGQIVPGILLVPAAKEIAFLETPENIAGPGTNDSAALPLNSVAKVHRLKREEAQRGYAVRIKGVVTSVLPEHQGFTIQDSTRGLYAVDFSGNRSSPPRIGEFLEIEGTTDPSLFAPIVNARRVTSLGAGHLPEPIRPTWDQLMNGSLDAQYVEVEGIVTAVELGEVTLLTAGGIIKVDLRVTDMKPGELKQFENALIRVRGCLFASWDYLTHQVKMGEVRIYGADIFLNQPAPADLFSIPEKTAAELRLFDPQAGVFQRVKVAGQIICSRDAEYFMMEGGKGIRFIAKNPAQLETGDEVEVVGFPDLLSSASPLLRESLVRRTGHRALPAPRLLPAEELFQAANDSTVVRLEGVLVNATQTHGEQTLEMQNGVRTFVARLSAGKDAMPSIPLGSRLELTGVYAGVGGNRSAGQDITSFELLIHSGSDIRVLARPPWWTLERLLFIVGALACVLAGTVLWITQLHRKVEERTAQLGAQILERQRVENQRTMEQERARIAQDLHDELGSGITEISMLAARAKSGSAPGEKRERHLDQVGQKARAMVAALDEIVWAMNPGHDSLASLVSYLCLYADRFLGLANIAWQLDGPAEQPDRAVDSRHRHQLFMAFKEALTNIVRHSNATEVRLNIQVTDGQLKLSIADNGCGLPSSARTEEMNGVANMRMRIEKLAGTFEIGSEVNRGTTVRFCVPLN